MIRRSFIKDETTLFFKNKAEAFRKNYSIISAKYVHAKNTTFIYKKIAHFCVIIFHCLHLRKKYLLKAHTKNPNISFLKSCLKVPNAKYSNLMP